MTASATDSRASGATRLEPATVEEFDLAGSGDAAVTVVPAMGGGPRPRHELWPAFLVERSWRPVGVRVRRRSTSMLELRIGSPAGCPEGELDRVSAQVRRMLSLDLDGAAFGAVLERDRRLRGLRWATAGTRPILFGSPYEAACWAVICQGLRTDVAVRAFQRVVTRYGRVAEVAGRSVAVPPPPGELDAVSAVTRLSADKRKRLAVVAEAARSGLLDGAALRGMEPEVAVRLVRQLPGIGDFSAELIVARGAGHPDVFPAHDRLLTTVMERLYARPPERVAACWAPYRSWASFLLRAVALRGVRPQSGSVGAATGGASP